MTDAAVLIDGPKVLHRAVAPLRIVVAQRPVSADRERHPYVALLGEALAGAGLEVRSFSARGVTTDRPDVIHVHWPEHLLVPGLKARLRALAMLAALVVARRRGTRLVHTAHNLAPHDDATTSFARWFLGTFDSLVDDLIVMADAGTPQLLAARPGLRGANVHHIRHGEFGPLVPVRYPRDAAKAHFGLASGRCSIVFVGQVRPYKGVPDLVDSVQGVDADLLIAGPCTDATLAADLRRAATANGRVRFIDRFLDADELARAVRAADLIVLPYRQILNSGSVLLALSAGRRVLVPSTPTFLELADEVGPGWVHTYVGRLDRDRLADALAAPEPDGQPDLSLHAWDLIGEAHRRVYEAEQI